MNQPEDPEMQRFEQRLDDFHKLPPEARLELAIELLRRPGNDRRDQGYALLKAAYPSAADELLHSGAFHVYWELPSAMCNLLAWIELSLKSSKHEFHAGLNSDVLYHLYNGLQLEALVPYGSQDVLDELKEVAECIENDDKSGAIGTLKQLMERFDASLSPPNFE